MIVNLLPQDGFVFSFHRPCRFAGCELREHDSSSHSSTNVRGANTTRTEVRNGDAAAAVSSANARPSAIAHARTDVAPVGGP